MSAAPAPEGAAAQPSRPFYTRGWFFVALGVVILGGAAASWAATSGGGDTPVPQSDLGNAKVFR